MKKVVLAAMAMALVLGGTAKADMFDYARLSGGATIEPSLDTSGFSQDMRTGYNVAGALGWNLAPEFQLEAEGMFTASNFTGPLITGSALETFSFMANAYWSFDCGGSWRPYVGAGLGGAQVTITDGTFNFIGSTAFTGDSDIVFAYQAMAGVSIPIADKIDLNVEYRYQGADDADLTLTNGLGGTISVSQEYKSHNLGLGLKFHL